MDNQEKKQIVKRHNKKALYQTVLLAGAVAAFLLVLCGGLFVIFRTYTISFDLGDGSEILTENYTVGSGKISLGTPQRDGYRFTGWTGSNGSEPKINVTVGEGQLGNLSYVANWSDELNVTCEDWVVDADGNLIENITDKVDKFLKDGNSGKGYKVVDRTIRVKVGSTINPSKWGEDKSYKAYEADYVYVGNSGDEQVDNDGLVVYRYFNPVLDVNYVVDGESASKLEIDSKDLAQFNLYVDNELVLEKVSDCCAAVPYGSKYRIEPCWVGAGYTCLEEGDITGVMPIGRCNVDVAYGLSR